MRKILKKIVMHLIWCQHRRELRGDMRLMTNRHPELGKKETAEAEHEWLEYWKPFGWKPDMASYRVFSKFVGNKKEILPWDICRNFIEPILNPGWTEWFYNDKNALSLLVPEEWMPKIYWRSVGGKVYCNHFSTPPSNISYGSIISFPSMVPSVVVKSVRDTGGKGFDIFSRDSSGIYKNKMNERLTIEYMNRCYGADWLVQEMAQQSDFTKQFNPSSLNTIRCITYRDVKTGEIHVLGSVLRIGSKGTIVDNASAGGSFVSIEDDGTLGKYACNHFGDKKSVFNDIDFSEEEFMMPGYDRVKSFAVEVTKRVPHASILALDIYLDQTDSPKLIEVNTHCLTIYFLQMTKGAFFGEYTDDIVEYCSKRIDRLSAHRMDTYS